MNEITALSLDSFNSYFKDFIKNMKSEFKDNLLTVLITLNATLM